MTGDKKPVKRRVGIVVGVIVAVLVCAGAGMLAWHAQPSFCNAVCHEPMDHYVQGYFGEGDAEQVAGAKLAQAHQEAGVTCLQCHEAKVDEQIKEATAWTRGDFSLEDDGAIHGSLVTADKKSCAKDGCHNWDEVVAATEDWGGDKTVNPHKSHQGEAIDCSNCHRMHEQSVMYCNACHECKVPDGWTEPAHS